MQSILSFSDMGVSFLCGVPRGDQMTEPHQISHNIQLKSAYSSVLGDEPRYTNYTANYKGVLDYIWYTQVRHTGTSNDLVPHTTIVDYTPTTPPTTRASSTTSGTHR
jgi:hypothetical protein